MEKLFFGWCLLLPELLIRVELSYHLFLFGLFGVWAIAYSTHTRNLTLGFNTTICSPNHSGLIEQGEKFPPTHHYPAPGVGGFIWTVSTIRILRTKMLFTSLSSGVCLLVMVLDAGRLWDGEPSDGLTHQKMRVAGGTGEV